jgi:alkanesulfonate monooxygenase SsuD/methylene tetrahydromethanopterin reductase-like flavin-dependent oxidoreductase (luciferase family)
MFEAYSILGSIAAKTSRLQLGVLAAGVTYRNPAFLAKEVAGLDVLACGRAWLGIGAAWLQRARDRGIYSSI